MEQKTARLLTVMISNYLDKYNVGLPSSYLETIEGRLVENKFEEVFTFVEGIIKAEAEAPDMEEAQEAERA